MKRYEIRMWRKTKLCNSCETIAMVRNFWKKKMRKIEGKFLGCGRTFRSTGFEWEMPTIWNWKINYVIEIISISQVCKWKNPENSFSDEIFIIQSVAFAFWLEFLTKFWVWALNCSPSTLLPIKNNIMKNSQRQFAFLFKKSIAKRIRQPSFSKRHFIFAHNESNKHY